MLNAPELARFRKALLEWFRQFQRDLPWRRSKDPYRIWVSEIMLQQTRVAAVIPYYKRFLERFPNVRALAAAPPEEVLRLWSGLGYYSRARNLQHAAQQIVAKQGGQFPEKLEEALALPGIGAYTAAAILSIAHGARLAVLDGNVARVLARLDAIRGDLRGQRRWRSLQETANALLDQTQPGAWNQAMMELGATLCTPRSPQCLLCPVAGFCEARRLGIADVVPERRKKREPVAVTLATAVFVDRRGRTLLLPPPNRTRQQEPRSAVDDVPTLVSRMWHFPTIAVRKNPKRELLQRLWARTGSASGPPFELVSLEPARHTVTFRAITIFAFAIPCAELPQVVGGKALSLSDVSALAVSNLTRKVARRALALASCEDGAKKERAVVQGRLQPAL
jgi:A/G-specific adenine glycosylase